MQRINVQLQENLVAIIVKILYVRVFAGMVEQLTAGRSFFQKPRRMNKSTSFGRSGRLTQTWIWSGL
ncbi:hypothetical protein NIA69_09800 [Gemmiger formicilis]|nr:hypothetical protein [Gemmiger formicilis]